MVVLGIKWLQIYNISIKWTSNIAIFNSLYYKKNYLSKEQIVIILNIIDVPELFKVQEKKLIDIYKLNIIITLKKIYYYTLF